MRPLEAARKRRVIAGLGREDLIYFRRAGRVRALVYNAVAQTGLRRNEVTLVRIQDVDFDNGVIWLPPKVAKSKREQYVRLNSDLGRRVGEAARPALRHPSDRGGVLRRQPPQRC